MTNNDDPVPGLILVGLGLLVGGAILKAAFSQEEAPASTAPVPEPLTSAAEPQSSLSEKETDTCPGCHTENPDRCGQCGCCISGCYSSYGNLCNDCY